jgi:pimeloyl-ACP methyl ester carboxylesterase
LAVVYFGQEAGAGDQPSMDGAAEKRSVLFDAPLVLFKIDGHRAFMLKPPESKGGGPKPWVWYAPTLLADREEAWISPGERHAWVFERLLAAGFYVVGVDVGESWGSPAGRAVYDKFYERMVHRLGFAPKACLLPVSRGGLMAYNWAADHPEHVKRIGGIYPVVNFHEYPRRERVRLAYGLSEAQVRAEMAQHNPLDRIAGLAAARVPILHVQGDRDKAVPLESHSAELARRYRALGGKAEIIVVPDKGHEVAPELWQEPRLVEFFVKGLRLETAR